MEERLAAATPVFNQMKSYLPALGIYEATIPAIEESYEDLLRILNIHLLHHPYILGGRPSLADIGPHGQVFSRI